MAETLGIDGIDPQRHPTAHRLIQAYDADGAAAMEKLKAKVAQGSYSTDEVLTTLVVPMMVDLWRALIEVAANLDEVANASGLARG